MNKELAIELYGVRTEIPSDSFLGCRYITEPRKYEYDYKVHSNYGIDDDFSTAFNDLIWLCDLRLMSMDWNHIKEDFILEKIYINRNWNVRHKFIFT